MRSSSKVARWIEQETDRQDVSTQRGREDLRKLGTGPQVPQPSLWLRPILKNRGPLKRFPERPKETEELTRKPPLSCGLLTGDAIGLKAGDQKGLGT